MSQLALPPLFDTDIATSENYYTKTVSGSPSPAININKALAVDADGIVAIDNTPAGFPLSKIGTYAMVYTFDGGVQSGDSIRVFYHAAAGSVEALQTGWVEAGIHLNPTIHTGLFTRVVRGELAAQRNGDYVYVAMFGGYSAQGPLFDPGESRLYETYTSDSVFKLLRIHPDGTIETRLNVTISNADQGHHDGTGMSRAPLRGMDRPIGGGVGVPQMFVSDDATPFIWEVTGDISSNRPVAGHVDGTASEPTVCAFADNGSSPGTAHELLATDLGSTYDRRVVYTGPIGGYAQKCRLPSGQYGFGPTIVYPWAAGTNGPPELWFFLHVGTTGSTFDIYRARWQRGENQRFPDIKLGDDSAYDSGTRRFPASNPDGWAFETSWFDAAHKVSTISFPGADVYDPRGTRSQASTLISFPYFKVMRDRKRVGKLHFVFGDGKDHSGGYSALPVLDSLWTSVSTDDGVTWPTPTKIQSRSAGVTQGVDGNTYTQQYFMGGVAALRTYDDKTVVAIDHISLVKQFGDTIIFPNSPADSGSHAALAVLDYNPTGIAEPSQGSVIFKSVGTGIDSNR